MANKREFYAGRQVAFAKDGTTTYIEAHGLQTLGITTNFNLQQVFEMGQAAIYANLEDVPDVEITMEKVLDGYPLLYHLATNGALSPSVIGRSNVKSTVAVSTFADTQDAASGTPIAEVAMSGLVPSNSTITIPVDGNITESLTLVGNSKVWRDTGITLTGQFNNNDAPMTTGNVTLRRQNVVMVPISGGPSGVDVNGANNGWVSVWPKDIPGISSDGTNPVAADGTFVAPIQNVTITVDMGRTNIFELGRKFPYWRFLNIPVEVRTDIEVLSTKWDNISATEAGGTNGAAVGSNAAYQTIGIYLTDGTWIRTGTRNKLATVAISGGDAGGGGGNVTHRYSYVTYNDYIIKHPQDPSGL